MGVSGLALYIPRAGLSTWIDISKKTSKLDRLGGQGKWGAGSSETNQDTQVEEP